MKVLKYPVILIVLFVVLGILFNHHFKPAKITIAITACVAIVCFLITFWQAERSLLQRPYFLAATCLLSFVTGITVHWLHYAPNNPLHYTYFNTNSDVPVIKGVVAERLKPNDYYEKYYFDISSIDHKAAYGKVLLSVPKDSLQTKLQEGQIIIIANNLQLISQPLNPYQFNYGDYMAKQNVFHQLHLKDNYLLIGTEKDFAFYIGKLRTILSNSFSIHKYSPEVKNIINALLLGQRQDMDKTTTDNFTNAGVIHILAISGLHFATLFYILNILFKPLSRLNRRGRLWQLIIVLSVLWVFAFITGLSASVIRSVVMFSFVGIGQYFNRSSNIFNSLAVSMLVLLLAKPNFLFDVGFQLSYAAVFTIVWLQPLYSRLRTSKYKAVNYLTDTIIISLVAQIGVLPLSLYYFNQFPLLFLLANIVVIPLSTAILLIGLTVLLLNFMLPSVSVLLGKMLEWLIILMNGFIEWIASFDRLVLKNIPFSLLLNIVSYIVIILFVRWMFKKNYFRTSAVLISIITFQLIYIITSWASNNSEELIIFNNRKASILAIKDNDDIVVYSNDSLAYKNTIITSYNKEHFNLELITLPLQNVMWFKGKKIMIIDSTAMYTQNSNPDFLLLRQSPKVNPERILQELKPRHVIADATNYKSYTDRWQATCKKANIPFHATNKEGFYRIYK